MRAKLLTGLFALMLCMSVFLFPVTAFAATDTTPPTVDAWLSGDTLHIETSDNDSGVEAVYMDGRRYNYFVDGIVQVNAKEHHGGEENISVYAIDFAGNKSKVIEIKNPFYKAPAASAPSSTPQGTTPAPNPTPAPSSSSSRPSQSTSAPPAASSTPEPSASSELEPTSSVVPDSSTNPFTPDGQADVTDNATDDDGKEFFTITTPEGNVFFLVIDRQRGSENVYLLNAVTEYDLTQLAESGGSTQSAIPTPEPAPAEPTSSPSEPEPTPEPEPAPAPKSNTGMIVFILIAVVLGGGAGYYFKIYKPKQQAPDAEDEYGEYDDDGEEMEYEDDQPDSEDEYDVYADEPDYEYPDDTDYEPGDDEDALPEDEE